MSKPTKVEFYTKGGEKVLFKATETGKGTIYKSIMLPAELQEKIKILATKQKKTIIQFIKE